jgi:HAD superfamily hydrolase (TIGR01509 family)
MTFKAVLFDHDGTLVDSEVCHFEHWVKVLKRFSIDLSKVDYATRYAGVPSASNAIEMVSRFNLDLSGPELLLKKNQTTREYLSDRAFPLMTHALESIEVLHKLNVPLGMVTGASRMGMNRTIDYYELGRFLKVRVSADDVKQSKPAPDCYLLAVNQLELESHHCIAIEDTEHGVASAIGAGLSCIAIPNELSKTHDFSKATIVLPHLNAAMDWLEPRLCY